MTYVFWVSAVGAIFSYFIYPAILLLLPKRRSSAGSHKQGVPRVSIVITARNEAARIRTKLENTLALNYPRDQLEIIVASDASTDETDSIVSGFGTEAVRLVRANNRKGKEYAQGLAIQAATGDILVFSDVATDIPREAIGRLVDRFTDPCIGAVSSEDRFVTEAGELVGEGAYVRYEMWLRRLESNNSGLVGLSGSFFAARKAVCNDWNTQVPSDFNTALNCVRLGLIAVSDQEVQGRYKAIQDERKEYQRKYRTVIRGISAVAARPDVMNPMRFGFFAFQMIGHKIMRWAVPWFLVSLLIATVVLYGQHWLFNLAMAGQAVLYGLAAIGWLLPPARRWAPVKIAYFFIQANVAILHATLAYVGGKRVVVWEPSKR